MILFVSLDVMNQLVCFVFLNVQRKWIEHTRQQWERIKWIGPELTQKS